MVSQGNNLAKSGIKILGVSQIVWSGSDINYLEEKLNNYSYKLKFESINSPNAEAKKPFIFGEMPETADVKLMVSENHWPPIELVKENYLFESNRNLSEPVFSAYLNSLSSSENLIPIKGIRIDSNIINDTWRKEDKFVIYIDSSDLEENLKFWKILEQKIITLKSTFALVEIKKTIIGSGITIIYEKSKEMKSRNYINQKGIVCISFFCSGIERLNILFKENKFETGEIFQLSPFGRLLKIFFVQNKSGELYEFISPDSNY
jgi:hypothetical protein